MNLVPKFSRSNKFDRSRHIQWSTECVQKSDESCIFNQCFNISVRFTIVFRVGNTCFCYFLMRASLDVPINFSYVGNCVEC